MKLLRNRLSSGLGCIFEWYDFALYGFFAPVIAKLYFPSDLTNIAIIKTLAIFTVGFCSRPIGALIFGYISDKYGRATCLKLTPLLITLPTVCMALLPTYQQIGLFAPLLLTIIRILQGICIGGEFTNNIIYFCESSSSKYRYFFGSIGAFTGSIGIMIASYATSLSFFIFQHNVLLSYGWRIGFFLSAPLGLLIYFIRRNLDETIIYKNIRLNSTCSANPIIESYQDQFHNYLKSIGLIYFPATAFYFIFMFIPNYMNSISINGAHDILGNNALSLLSRLLFIPLMGLIADRWSGIGMIRLSCVLFIIFSIPLFDLLLHNPALILFPLLAFGLLSTINSATIPGLLIQILKPNTRSTIASFSFNFSFGVLGGIVPTLGFLLIQQTNIADAPVYYLIFSALVTLFTTFYIKKDDYHE